MKCSWNFFSLFKQSEIGHPTSYSAFSYDNKTKKLRGRGKKQIVRKSLSKLRKRFLSVLINCLVGLYKPNVFLNFNEINDILTFVTWGSSFYLQRSSNLQAKLLL